MSEENENKVPHVYEGMFNVLKALSVEKNGVLPGNMGSRPYITAVDASAEVKRQFVANDLLVLSNEHITKHEIINVKDRLSIATVIEGSYKIVSKRDGSSDVISGVGDGLAIGTAVSSNIASTNALKNALLRTFLITEQSVEDEAKNGSDTPAAPASRTEQQIAKAGQKPAAPQASNRVKELQDAIKAAAEARKKSEPDFQYLAFGKQLLGKDAQGWTSDAGKLERVLKAVQDGEVL